MAIQRSTGAALRLVLAVLLCTTVTLGFATANASAVTPKVQSGYIMGCSLSDTGAVRCWGTNADGLGDGVSTASTVPVDIVGLSSGVKDLAVTASGACAITATDSVSCWGSDWAGQLGGGGYRDGIVPLDVPGIGSGVKAITAGGAHICALTEAGNVMCWGDNQFRELGSGIDDAASFDPRPVVGLPPDSIKFIAATSTGYGTCAVTTSDDVYCWGDNEFGQLHTGNFDPQNSALLMPSVGTGISQIALAGFSFCVLTTEATVKCMGSLAYGMLGDAYVSDGTVWTEVPGLAGIKSLGSAFYSYCAITASSSVKCWGDQTNMQLGYTGGSDYDGVPHDVQDLGTPGNEVMSIGGGWENNCAITILGIVRCWGANGGGQLGYVGGSSAFPLTILGPKLTSAPVIEFTSPIDGSVTGASSTAVSFTAVSLAGADLTCDRASGVVENLVEGANAFSVTCHVTDDPSLETTATTTVTRADLDPPVITITSPRGVTTTTDSSVDVVFSVTDDLDTDVDCSLVSGEPFALDVGLNTITVDCIDDAGHASAASVDLTRVDASPPVVTITSPLSGTTNSATGTLEFTASDNLPGTTCDATDGSSLNYKLGTNTIKVTCTDAAGNIAIASATVTFVDNTPPVVDWLAPQPWDTTTSPTIAMSYSVSDDADSSPSCNTPSGSNVPVPLGGSFVNLSCSDDSGNTTSLTRPVTRDDVTAPVVTISAPVNGALTTASAVALTYSATDESSFDCSTPSGTSTALSIGANTLSVTCTDDGNHATTAQVSITRLDVTGPVITINSPANGATTHSASATLDFTATDNSGVAPTCTPTSGTTVALRTGVQKIIIVCTDGAQNRSTAETTVDFVDTTAPVVNVTAPVDASQTSSAAATLAYTVSDDTDTHPVCNRPNGAVIPLAVGANTIHVICTDDSGNATDVSVAVTRNDVTGPLISINSPVNGSSTTDTTGTLVYNVADDSGVAPTCDASSGSLVNFAIGANTIKVVCTDGAGNSSNSSVTVTRAAIPTDPVAPPASSSPVTKLIGTPHLSKHHKTAIFAFTCASSCKLKIALKIGNSTKWRKTLHAGQTTVANDASVALPSAVAKKLKSAKPRSVKLSVTIS